jgi:glycosyltransferase involved in cell wall biosynthesis
MERREMKVFILTEYFAPAYKAGGPVRSLGNIVAQMGDSHQFFVLCGDRDLGDVRSFEGVQLNQWNELGSAKVYHSSPEGRMRALVRELWRVRPDVVYANGLFSRLTIRYLVARALGIMPRAGLVIAPRGELSPGALGLKGWKKRPFIAVARASGLLRGAVWQACAELEASEMRIALGRAAERVCVARNMAGPSPVRATTRSKESGAASFLFLSRISPKKNLEFALECFEGVRGKAHLTIAGPIDDAAYWERCLAVVARLPQNVSVRYVGAVKHEEVPSVMEQHSFLVLPTLGENYGHVIQEALAAGCPPLISDTTPWRGLEERGVGWDILLDAGKWTVVLQRCIDMEEDTYCKMTDAARRLGLDVVDRSGVIAETAKMFERACLS